jgi:2-keto-4-pentenoate hydratase/2-oxohepta-3-ene-1,7-dioic acid hydratase in catechol pathway
MRTARLRTDEGIVEGRYENGIITTKDGEYEVGRDGDLHTPCSPTAVYCVGRNYANTIEQMDYERPDDPEFFIKPPASIVGHEDVVRYPSWTDELTYAGELAAVIGTRCRAVRPAAVPDVVAGYTIMNDIDALDQSGRTARKAFDGSGPLGPWIESDIDPRSIDMETVVSGEVRQAANTSQMLFDPYEIVSFLSHRFTFRPGDVVAFGSPANPGTIEPGDVVEITYEGVGTLRNAITSPEE